MRHGRPQTHGSQYWGTGSAEVRLWPVTDPATLNIWRAEVGLPPLEELPHGEISFVHSLMQRAVYAEIGASCWRFLHGRAANWFERAGQFAAAAFHFERAERTADMVRTASLTEVQAHWSASSTAVRC
jgi:hypothetical protein